MFNGNISQSLDRNHSLLLLHSKSIPRKQNKNIINSIENLLPLYTNTILQNLNVKSNSINKINSQHNILFLPRFRRKLARMEVAMSKRKPMKIYFNISHEKKDDLYNTSIGAKNGDSINKKK